jgi:hypothetical protein
MKHQVEQLTEDVEIKSGGQPKSWPAGSWKASIDLEDGSPKSNYYGATEKDVLDAVLSAQANASVRIKELKRAQHTAEPRAAVATPQVAPLTSDQAFKLTNDLNDPSKAPAAVARIVEAHVGIPLKTLGNNATEESQQRIAEKCGEAAAAFVDQNPEYKFCPHNSGLMVNYIAQKNWDPTDINAYQRTYNDLRAMGLLALNTAAAEEDQPEAAPPATAVTSVTRPRVAAVTSSGLRAANGSATPVTRKKMTRAELERMPANEYNRRLKEEPGFRAAVDALV